MTNNKKRNRTFHVFENCGAHICLSTNVSYVFFIRGVRDLKVYLTKTVCIVIGILVTARN